MFVVPSLPNGTYTLHGTGGREGDRKANGLLYFMQNCSHHTGTGNGSDTTGFHTNFSVPAL